MVIYGCLWAHVHMYACAYEGVRLCGQLCTIAWTRVPLSWHHYRQFTLCIEPRWGPSRCRHLGLSVTAAVWRLLCFYCERSDVQQSSVPTVPTGTAAWHRLFSPLPFTLPLSKTSFFYILYSTCHISPSYLFFSLAQLGGCQLFSFCKQTVSFSTSRRCLSRNTGFFLPAGSVFEG